MVKQKYYNRVINLKINNRLQVILLIDELLTKKKSLTELQQKYARDSALDNAWLKEVSFGVCRWYTQLKFIIDKLLQKPFTGKNQIIEVAIMIGLYQLLYMRVPSHAAVSETVNAVKQLKKQWAVSLVNAVLRNFERQKEKILLEFDRSATFSHPTWLLNKISDEDILNENNRPAPLSLRVNLRKTTRDDFLKKLRDKNIEFFDEAIVPCHVMLKKPMPVTEIPGFDEGLFSVQDAAAQLAAYLLPVQKNSKILDACAAPGGKTSHILEKNPDVKLTAVDNNEQRLKRVRENLSRLQLNANVIAADIMDIESWWDGEVFDAILLDAPCSATGVIRRHPDIKILRQESDIKHLAELQVQLLEKILRVLKPGGVCLYVTCSVLEEENDAIIMQFVKKNSSITAIPHLPNNINKALLNVQKGFFGWQLQTSFTHDGFYYALLKKSE